MSANYGDLNETELVELCRDRGLMNPHRGLGRQILEGILKGNLDEEDYPHDPIDDERDLMAYTMFRYPTNIYGQLKCSDEGYFCPKCPTGRVVACMVVDLSAEYRKDLLHEFNLLKARNG